MTAIADEIDVLAASKSSLGGPLFSTAAPMAMRFDSDTVFAPVPSRSSAFEVGGSAISQQLRTVGTAIAAGNAPQIATSLSDVKAAIDHVANVHAEIGINASRLERLRDTQARASISMSAERSMLEDTDLSSAIAKLSGQNDYARGRTSRLCTYQPPDFNRYFGLIARKNRQSLSLNSIAAHRLRCISNPE